MNRNRRRLLETTYVFLCAVVGVAIGVWKAPGEPFFAGYVVVSFLVLAGMDLLLAFLALVFITQFFIGDFYRPYMYLLDILSLVFVIVWFMKTEIRGKRVTLPLWWLVVPYVLVVLLAIPLNLKEIVLDMKTWGIANFLREITGAGTLSHGFWLRELSWELMSFFLFLSVFNLFVSRTGDEEKIWYTLTVALITCAVAGVMLLYDWIPYEGQFLSINFAWHAHNLNNSQRTVFRTTCANRAPVLEKCKFVPTEPR